MNSKRTPYKTVRCISNTYLDKILVANKIEAQLENDPKASIVCMAMYNSILGYLRDTKLWNERNGRIVMDSILQVKDHKSFEVTI